VRELIEQFRESNREPFPQWGSPKTIVVPRMFDTVTNPGGFVM
jgi:hypothetical protein